MNTKAWVHGSEERTMCHCKLINWNSGSLIGGGELG